MAKSPSSLQSRGPAKRPSGVRRRNQIAKGGRARPTLAAGEPDSGEPDHQPQSTADHAAPAVTGGTARNVKVLILEGMPADAELVEHSLREGGLACTVKRVDRRKAYEQALKAFAPDVVLSAFNLPGINGLTALEIARRHDPDLPVIIVTSALDDESAVELIQAGARGYLRKDRLATLPLTVERVLIEREQARARKQAGAMLWQSEERFRGLVENLREWVWEIDTRGVFTYCSTRSRDFVGREPEELIGTRFFDILAPEEAARVAVIFKEALERGTATNLPTVVNLTGKSGEDVIVEVSSVAVQTADGSLRGFQGTTRNITEQTRLERERDRQAAILSAVQETSPDGILVIDSGGRMLLSNRRFLEIWKIPQRKATIGAGDADLLKTAIVRTEDPASFLALVEDIYRRPDAKSRDEIKLKDGRILDRYSAPARLANGESIARAWFFRDITERKQAERTIQESEDRFRGLVDQAIAGVFIIKADGVMAYVNSTFARALGYEPEEVIGRSMLDFIADDETPAVIHTLTRLISGEIATAQMETVLKRKDGGLIDVLSQSTRGMHEDKPVSIGVLIDVSERKKAEASLRRVDRILLTLIRGGEALVRAESESQLMQSMCHALVLQGGYRLAWIGIAEHDKAKTVTKAAWAGEDGYVDAIASSWANNENGSEISGRAVRLGKPQIFQNMAAKASKAPWMVEALKHGFCSSAALPLLDGSRVFAVLSLYSRDIDAFTGDEMSLLQRFADDLAYGIRALRARADQEATNRLWRAGLQQTIEALASTSEVRDPYTTGHQRRVATLATAIAHDLKMPKEQIQGIFLAGTIHDIGKITIPSEILTKPGKLTPLEFQLVQTHAQSGYDMVKNVEFPWPIADAILQHHERIDGSGYPNGLKGNEIILEAKVIAVADVVEAMTSHRPYRPALGLDAALDEIEKGKGRLYDPAVVDACLRVFREQGFQLS